MPRLQAACCAQPGGGTAPAVFPIQPDFASLASLKPSPGLPLPQLDIELLNFKYHRAGMSNISLDSPRYLLAEQRFCQALNACSPDGAWLLSASPLQPLALQCWNVLETWKHAVLSVPEHDRILGVSWSSDSQKVAITFLCPQQPSSPPRRVVHTYSLPTAAPLGASALYSARCTAWRQTVRLDPLRFSWQPSGSAVLAGLADDALLVLGADCSVAARVPLETLLAMDVRVLQGDLLCYAWVPGSCEAVCYVERASQYVLMLHYVSVSPVVGALRCEKAPFPLCYPVFGAWGRIAGITARDAEVIIAHTAPGSPGEVLYTGFLRSKAVGSPVEQPLLAWSPDAELLAVGGYASSGDRLTFQSLHFLDGTTGKPRHVFTVDAVSKVPLGLEVLDPAGADALFRRRSNFEQRVSWCSSGRAVCFSLLLHMPGGSDPTVGISSHFVVRDKG